jgi:hypothetical protein
MPMMRLPILFFLLSVLVIVPACTREQTTNVPAETPTSPPTPASSPLTGFERDLQFIRNGQYTYVLVVSRMDGKPLDKADGDFLRKNASQVVDWVMSDGGKKAIGGTNFNFEEGNMELLKKRFVVEDYSGR